MRLRREPPKFRRVEVRRIEALTPRLTRITLAGAELDGLAIDQPAASVRLLLPPPGRDELVMPEWTGNLFVLPGGERATLRTFTPRRLDRAALELELEIVIHGKGAASEWAAAASLGTPAAISGPARGYDIDSDAASFVLAGDETALPAISQLLEQLPQSTSVTVHVEVGAPEARLDLPPHPGASVTWHDAAPGDTPGGALVAAVRATTIPDGARVWVAGEAASVQRIRKYLFEEAGMSRREATVRGYWKHGRSADASDAGDAGDD